ncbi:MAG: cytochrome c [Chloroflexi bacterium]|nr:cytochrome c [Chloroflexota bacterium]
MGRYLVPASGLLLVTGLAMLLIVVVVLRPWSDANSSWKTHLNLAEAAPPGYARTVPAYAGETGPLAAWMPSPSLDGVYLSLDAPSVDEGRVLYIARGCASCHGLDARGAVFGADLPGHSMTKVMKGVRKPLGRMPGFGPADLSDEELEKIAAYIASLAPVKEEEEGGAVAMDPQAAALHQAILDALKTGDAAGARDRFHELMDMVADQEEHHHQMEEVEALMDEGKLHDAEHELEEMLEGQSEEGQDTPQSHVERALEALENRELDSVSQHLEQFLALAPESDRAQGQKALDLLKAKEYHTAEHEMEKLLGMPVHGGE